MFIRYVLVGFVNLFVCVSMMKIGALMDLSYLLYTLLGYATAMLCSFLLNSYFTFSNKHFTYEQFWWFFLINSFNLTSVEGLEYMLIEKAGMLELPTILIGMIWYTILGFLMNQRFVFGQKYHTT